MPSLNSNKASKMMEERFAEWERELTYESEIGKLASDACIREEKKMI